MSIEKLFDSKILICAGSGGVGKTTVSSSLAWKAAKEGKKVLVMTIDPSKRLASCLGLENWDGKEKKVKDFSSDGELWASMIDAKKTFDDFVMENSREEQEGERLLKNRLYQEISTSLSGSQEFTSLHALYKTALSGKYDLIILDTPPAQHTLDFIESPKMLYSLFSGPVVEWFSKLNEKRSSVFSIFHQSTKLALSALEKLTGSDFLNEMQDFFKVVSSITENIQKTLLGVQNLLSAQSTQFVIVCNVDDSKLQDAQSNVKEFKRRGFKVDHIVINRVVPEFKLSEARNEAEQRLISFYKRIKNHSDEQLMKITGDESRHFKIIKLWSLPQIERVQDELVILETLAENFRSINQ